ncbi:fungal-specific transcription factor domain-containing protein [Xylogone sp. PMI_703]|nr:fungal-specific transcription factor domain-containing protein [Xylogone sp. PMI_703]
MYMILHEPTFREQYDSVWQSGPQPDDLWFCLLNMVFTLGSLFSDCLNSEDSESKARNFFAQATDLFNFDDIDYGSLAIVQALLLMGQYLHIRRVTRCWHVFGIAIRIAEGLGLQLSDANNKCDPVERETRKRCWCGCMVMDTMLAMTFGRPTMIPTQYYDNAEMPEPVDDVRIARESSAPQQQDSAPPRILLFIKRIKLCVILHRILQTLYRMTPDNGDSRFPAEEMMKFDQQLDAWNNDLPVSMRMKEPLEHNICESSSTRPRYMLYTRYLVVRILLTRPSLTVVMSMTSSTSDKPKPLDQAFALCVAEACVDTSKQLVDYIHTNLQVERALWHTTHTVFNAALVLFAAQIIPVLKPRIAETQHWEESIEIMRFLSQRCSSAQTCLSVLERFSNCLTQSSGCREGQNAGPDALGSSEFTISPSLLWQNWTDSFGFDKVIGREFSFI